MERNNIEIINYEFILPTGESNAILCRDLQRMMGFSSERQLRKSIEVARRSGQLIMSSAKGGYYLPKDRKEIEQYVRTLHKRAISILSVIKGAKDYLKYGDGLGQMTIDDFIAGGGVGE